MRQKYKKKEIQMGQLFNCPTNTLILFKEKESDFFNLSDGGVTIFLMEKLYLFEDFSPCKIENIISKFGVTLSKNGEIKTRCKKPDLDKYTQKMRAAIDELWKFFS